MLRFSPRHLPLLPGLLFAAPLSAQSSARPTLEVLIVVDQLRPDYLERYGAEFTGGLARFLRTGVVYTNGFQDHALTETAPGHSTLLSGRPPSSTGIFANDLGAI